MTLAHPALSTIGRKRGKRKFASADAARKHRELHDEWQRKQAEWAAMSVTGGKTVKKSAPAVTVIATSAVRDTPRPPSLNSWVTGAVSSKPTQQYTGDKMLGVTVMHKSCLQPVFNVEAARDAAKMRRG